MAKDAAWAWSWSWPRMGLGLGCTGEDKASNGHNEREEAAKPKVLMGAASLGQCSANCVILLMKKSRARPKWAASAEDGNKTGSQSNSVVVVFVLIKCECVCVCGCVFVCVCFPKWKRKWKSSQSPKTTAPGQINRRRSERQVIYLAIVRCFFIVLRVAAVLPFCLLLGIAPEHPTSQTPTHPRTTHPHHPSSGHPLTCQLGIWMWPCGRRKVNGTILKCSPEKWNKKQIKSVEKTEILPAAMALGIWTLSVIMANFRAWIQNMVHPNEKKLNPNILPMWKSVGLF